MCSPSAAHKQREHSGHHYKEIQMFVHEFALLVAASSPLAVLCSIHAGLWAAGERETLIIPVVREYPRIEVVDTEELVAPAPAPTIPQNEPDYRLAA
jgi:hypothetical protein